MKKQLIIILAVVLVLSFAACGSKEKDEGSPASDGASKSTETTTPEAPPAAPVPEQNMSITMENRDWTVAGMELTERDGEPILRVYYDVTSGLSRIDSMLFGSVSDRDAYQNGEELDSNISVLDDVEEYANYSREIYPGVTIRACENFELLDTTSDVELILARGDDKLTINVDLKNLPAPGPAPEIVPIPNPEDPATMSNYVGTEGTFSSDLFQEELTLKYLGSEIFSEGGQKYIRMNFDMTLLATKEGKETSPFMITRYYLFQDGIQIDDANAMNVGMPKIDGMGSPTQNVAVGDSHTYGVIMPLRTDSPVQIFASAWFNDPTSSGEEFVGELVQVN